jgi:DNA primase
MSNPFYRVSSKRRCTVCGKPDYCIYTDELDQCTRSIDYSRFIKTKYGKRGGVLHIHRREGITAVPRSEFVDGPKRLDDIQTIPLADIEVRDGVYSALLRQYLTLIPSHREALHERGLDDDEIHRLGYASTPNREDGQAIVRDLSAKFELRGVPGFWKDGGEWKFVGIWPHSFFIPYRDERGRIQALSYRRQDWKKGDDFGKYIWLSSKSKPSSVGSGAPLHWSRPHLLPHAQEVVVTEGALKADICAYFLNVPFIAAGGVTQFGSDFGLNLAQKFPHLQRVVLALDSDWRTNDAVRLGLSVLRRSVDDAGLDWRVRSWPSEFKGLDDYLLASRMDERREAA